MIKPFFDFLFALILLVLTSPFIIITAIVLFIQNRGDIFFFQERPGKNAKPFFIIKFKTMRDAFDVHGKSLPDHVRLTKAGSLIRSLSLDELLQLINVLKGEMSLVGPRPLLMKYLDRYNERQFTRHQVLPGITGLAQVNGRNAITWQEKFEWDAVYVERQNFWYDLSILLKTFFKVFKREGINPNTVGSNEFMGK